MSSYSQVGAEVRVPYSAPSDTQGRDATWYWSLEVEFPRPQ